MPTSSDHTGSDSRAIVEKAAEWYILCTDEELTVAQQRQLHQWLQASPRHLSELLQMPRLDSMLTWVLHPERASARMNTEVSSLRKAFELAGIAPQSVGKRARRGPKSRAVRPSVSTLRSAGVFNGVILAVVLGVVRGPEDLERLLAKDSTSFKLTDTASVSEVSAAVVIPQGSTPNGIVIVSDPV